LAVFANTIDRLVGAFLSENEFTHTSRSFLSERGSQKAGNLNGLPSLNTIYTEWQQFKEEKSKPAQNGTKKKDKKAVKKEVISESDSSSMYIALCYVPFYPTDIDI
jgi:hypothetical protein